MANRWMKILHRLRMGGCDMKFGLHVQDINICDGSIHHQFVAITIRRQRIFSDNRRNGENREILTTHQNG